jgi:protein LTV1
MIEKELNKGKYDPTIKPKSTEFDNPPDALDLVRGRDDLWINQLRK